jgi:hypothetical protein
MKAVCIVLCLLLLLPTAAIPEKKATMETGADVLQECGEDKEHTTEFCLGYIAGYVAAEDMRTQFVQRHKEESTLVCVPDGVSIGQLASLVRKFVKEHPGLTQQSGQFLIGAVLRDSYACPSAGPR